MSLPHPVRPRRSAPRRALAGSITLLLTPTAPLLAADAADFARDRQAILAMAGEFEVDFRFEETAVLAPGYTLREPYRNSARELVLVAEDSGERIVLQHILVVEGPDGAPQAVKHWRQDWTWEDPSLFEFQGHGSWARRQLERDEVRGTWSQLVTQIDDSPRYESLGRWMHQGPVSSWESGLTWRPLPRRETTVRDDYDVLVARNRQTVTPDGWVHEQDNSKLVLRPGEESHLLAREVGINTYRRTTAADLSAATAYWRATAEAWRTVREAWEQVMAEGETVHLPAELDGRPLWQHVFGEVDRLTQTGAGEPERRQAIASLLARFGLEPSPPNLADSGHSAR